MYSTHRVLPIVSQLPQNCKNAGKGWNSPLTAAVDSLSLVWPDDDVRQCGTFLKNEHGLSFAGLLLVGADASYNMSVHYFSAWTAEILTAAIVQLHSTVQRARDENGCVGGHGSRRFGQDCGHAGGSWDVSAAASGSACAGNNGRRRRRSSESSCCRAAGAGVVARTLS